MEFLKKYPKLFQWLFLLTVFFFLCFAIDVPETYKFIRGQAEFIKDPNQTIADAYKKREILYKHYSDHTVTNNRDIGDCVHKILTEFKL